ncbi:homoserine dehydrogenase [Stipitochalara longipes BDJ]|nr:homoserine dehydrogenase [Stipitochalara longipes BDJ]
MVTKNVFVGVIGIGGVGKSFISQLKVLAERLSRMTSPTNLTVVLVSRSKSMIYTADYSPLDINNYEQNVTNSKQEMLSLEKVVEYLAAAPRDAILVDITSSQKIADQYPNFLSSGVYIITPNKKAFAGSYKLWQDVFSAASLSGAKICHESSVCAGLPILSTLKELVDTGDSIEKIDGVFSGTLSFLFNSFAPVEGSGEKWSHAVKKTMDFGYTEADPREDLNGLILSGLPVQSHSSFPVESLIPKELESCTSGEEFMQKLHEYDSRMEEIKAAAEKEGKIVRYVGRIDIQSKQIRVGLENFDKSHPIAALKGSDNAIGFHTRRYGARPLIIQGAGAGGDLTAMGMTGDLIKIMKASIPTLPMKKPPARSDLFQSQLTTPYSDLEHLRRPEFAQYRRY